MNPQIGPAKEYFGFDLATMPPRRLDLGTDELVIAPGGRRYAVAAGTRGMGGPRTVILNDLPSLRETGRFEVTGLVGAGLSPDGRWLAVMVGRQEPIPQGLGTRYVVEIKLIDPSTARERFTIPSPGPTWGNYDWKFSPDGKSLAVYYRTGSNLSRPGEQEPFDRPMNVDLWELPAP